MFIETHLQILHPSPSGLAMMPVMRRREGSTDIEEISQASPKFRDRLDVAVGGRDVFVKMIKIHVGGDEDAFPV